MPIYGRKDTKLRRSTAKKQEYLDANEARIKRGDRNTPTYAQWAGASGTERGLMQAGITRKKVASLKRKR